MPFQRGLFDTGLRGPRPPGPPAEQDSSQRKAWTVTQITRKIKDCIERTFGHTWVQGEISNFKCYSSGHCYFTLKDDGAQLPAVMWRDSAARLTFAPEDGTKVLAKGRLSVYEPRGQYQFIVDTLEPLGVGDLAAAFEQLKRKLAAQGLFESARKRTLPPFPTRLGIVTSPTGAALRDLLKVIFNRWPVEIILAGVRVQGEGAAAEIAGGIRALNSLSATERPEVLIVGRGGGSLEDLWAFNEESLAQAIFQSSIPVISAVGHEIDFTIADFVADVRAATPSHAGEIVVPRLDQTLKRVRTLGDELPRALLRRMEVARGRLQGLEQSYALRHPEERIGGLRQRLDDIQCRLLPAGERKLGLIRERIGALAGRLDSLSPLKVLERGYSVTRRISDGKIVSSIAQLTPGDNVETRVRDGMITARVEELKAKN